MRKVLPYLIILISFFISVTCAQDSLLVSNISPMGGGTYKLEINEKMFRAIPEEMMKKFLKLHAELDALRNQNMIKDSLIAAYENTDFWYRKLLEQQKNYTGEMELLLKGYKSLISDYKKLSEPWLSISAALGASGDDTKPVMLFGLELHRLQFLGIFQERNSGILVGTKIPLF